MARPTATRSALTAGELLRLAIKELADAQNIGRFLDLLVDLGLGHLAELEAERHVVVDAHVRVERVALEHHGDIAILGGHIVDDAVADADLAVGDLLQAGQHAEAGALATARGADEDDEFLIGNFDVQIVDGDDIAITLEDMFEGDAGHGIDSSLVLIPPEGAIAFPTD